MPFLISFLASKAGVVGMIALALLTVFGVQALRLSHAQAGEKSALASVATCSGRLTDQNAALAAQSAKSVAALAVSDKAVAAVAPRAAHIASQGASLQSYVVKGSDELDRWRDADAEVKGKLQ